MDSAHERGSKFDIKENVFRITYHTQLSVTEDGLFSGSVSTSRTYGIQELVVGGGEWGRGSTSLSR